MVIVALAALKSGSSTSAAVSHVVDVATGAQTTTTTLTVFPTPAFQALPVVFLAHVAPRGATGTIQIMDGATALGSPLPAAHGFALLITTLPKGTHTLTAVFTPPTRRPSPRRHRPRYHWRSTHHSGE